MIEANGARSESFYPGVEVLRHLRGDMRKQIFDIIPELEGCLCDEEIRAAYGPRSRPVLGIKDVLRIKPPMHANDTMAVS